MARTDKAYLETRLTQKDLERFKHIAQLEGKTQTELLREVVLAYLDEYEADAQAVKQKQRDALIVKSLKGMENRFANILARLGVSLETLHYLMWDQVDLTKEQKDKLWKRAFKESHGRFKRRLDEYEAEHAGRLKKQKDTLEDSDGN